jgi:hypothetical protein
VFGIAMVIIGSTIEVGGEGTELLVTLSDRLVEVMGPTGKWLFLLGTLGAVFSSLLGVWQAVPYLFADCWRLLRGRRDGVMSDAVDTRARPYRIYLVLLAVVPMLGLFASFREVQKFYTVIGAVFFPLLALAVLVFNSRTSWVGERFTNRPVTIVALVSVLIFFSWLGLKGIGVG